jgi:hypothetical protein
MKPKKNPKKEVHQLIVGQQREKQKDQGFFDGRFVQRAEPSKKIYSRGKNKQWGRGMNDEFNTTPI